MITRERVGAAHGDFAPPRYWHVEPTGKDTFTRPVILLVNRLSVSAADNFALALRVLPHVTLLGDFTSGCFADASNHELPDGWTASVSYKLFTDHEGRCWEGIGVPPDLYVPADMLAVSADDPQLARALALLRTGGPAKQDESASARLARVSLSAQLARDLQSGSLEDAIGNVDRTRKEHGAERCFLDYEELASIANVLERNGRKDEALELLAWTVREFPEFIDAHYRLASFSLRRGRPDEARAAVERVLAINDRTHPRHVRFYVALALQQAVHGDDADALTRRFGELRREYPGAIGPRVLNTLGYEILGSGRVEDAITLFHLNVQTFPAYANGYDSLAEAYMNAGETELAIEHYEKALAMDPDNGNAVEMLKRLRADGS